MLRRYWRRFWGEPERDPTLAILEQMVSHQAAQAALLKGQLDLFQKWMEMFQQPAAPAQPSVDAQEQEMRDLISLSARMGNDDALDLLKDESALENYIRLARQSQ